MSDDLQLDVIEFFVHGDARPQGSTRAYIPAGWKHAIITSTSKGLKEWRRLVADVAQRQAPQELWEGPIEIELNFGMPRPKSAPKRVVYPITRPDIDKLARAILDALTKVIYKDDSQIVGLFVTKDYSTPGVKVVLSKLAK